MKAQALPGNESCQIEFEKFRGAFPPPMATTRYCLCEYKEIEENAYEVIDYFATLLVKILDKRYLRQERPIPSQRKHSNAREKFYWMIGNRPVLERLFIPLDGWLILVEVYECGDPFGPPGVFVPCAGY